MKLFTLPWNFLLFYLAKSGISWWYVFYFCSCWLTGIYSNASYSTFLLERWEYFACLCIWTGGGSEKMCSGLQFAHLCVAARPLCVCSCRHLSHLTSHAHRGEQVLIASWWSSWRERKGFDCGLKWSCCRLWRKYFERFFARWFTQEWIDPWLPSSWNLEEKEEKEM